MDPILESAKAFGIPATVILTLLFLILRGSSRFFSDFAIPLRDGHLRFVNEIQKIQTTQATTLEKLTQLVQQISDQIKTQQIELEKHGGMLLQHSQQLSNLADSVKTN